jgi:hypothetical protein
VDSCRLFGALFASFASSFPDAVFVKMVGWGQTEYWEPQTMLLGARAHCNKSGERTLRAAVFGLLVEMIAIQLTAAYYKFAVERGFGTRLGAAFFTLPADRRAHVAPRKLEYPLVRATQSDVCRVAHHRKPGRSQKKAPGWLDVNI